MSHLQTLCATLGLPAATPPMIVKTFYGDALEMRVHLQYHALYYWQTDSKQWLKLPWGYIQEIHDRLAKQSLPGDSMNLTTALYRMVYEDPAHAIRTLIRADYDAAPASLRTLH